ncbi:Etp1p KNAG_0C05660 [Huiozyma naganishii CBS 8797]|uniref:RING-type domain-containing protein n=1 Tax=Huiozyma naganishii (strain ATCC MYA-139 / BCRC 22969 / CBS 8797 / KCTC 17520 / NBRC 10181 / NCYC 3082 / Yp74L-3) TaxID=1071383 RepID=J7S549_HUIN7|nr:hypothetical protein KNAG_0C05660 [Kazachstania naganishii CBS 8797]CCK69664.1 hypothetical protein KNAG_0C05660 [Kazachstania naganishii CBS 8797]
MNRENDTVVSEYMGHGIIRLFKLRGEVTTPAGEQSTVTVPGDDTMVSILFVPTYFTVHDLLHFYIGDEIVNNQISNFRILQNHDEGVGFNFMVLMKFKDPMNAKRFKEDFNGKSFSKMDPEKCHVVFIKEVVFQERLFDLTDDDERLPYLLTDPFTQLEKPGGRLVELPACPVCLERMDSETTGLITIPCQHTFHCQCLNRWKNSKCPVCRYSSFRLSRDTLMRTSRGTPKCHTCGAADNLWICLVCGNTGCGRYNSKHAIQHYEETSHCFAMDIKTQRVWDYAGDNYVHRIVQNEVDGKLVEVSGNDAAAVQGDNLAGDNLARNTPAEDHQGKDLDLAENFLRNKEYHLEYVQVLISQLESQREYYEGKLAQCAEERSVGAPAGALADMQAQVKKLAERLDRATFEMDKERGETKLLVRGLQENVTHLTKQNESLEKSRETLRAEKTDVEEQLRDIMFYLDTQNKFKDATEEERDGAVVIQPTPGITDPAKKNPKKKKKKKKKQLP